VSEIWTGQGDGYDWVKPTNRCKRQSHEAHTRQIISASETVETVRQWGHTTVRRHTPL